MTVLLACCPTVCACRYQWLPGSDCGGSGSRPEITGPRRCHAAPGGSSSVASRHRTYARDERGGDSEGSMLGLEVHRHATITGMRNCFSNIVPGSCHFQLSDFAALGYALGLVFTIIVFLTITLTLTSILLTLNLPYPQ